MTHEGAKAGTQRLWKPKAKSKAIFKVPAMTLTSAEIRSL